MDVPNKTMAATLKQFQWSLYLIQASRMRSTYDSMAAASELQAASHQERRQRSGVPHFGPMMWLGSHLSMGRCEGLSIELQQSHSAVCVCNSDQRQTSKSQVSPILA